MWQKEGDSVKKITENGKMMAIWRHTSKTGHDLKNKILLKCFSDHTEQVLL